MGDNLYDSYQAESEAYATGVVWMPKDEEEIWFASKQYVVNSVSMGLVGWIAMYGVGHVFGAIF